MVTCSKDRSIAVWDMISPTEINLRRVLVGHRLAKYRRRKLQNTGMHRKIPSNNNLNSLSRPKVLVRNQVLISTYDVYLTSSQTLFLGNVPSYKLINLQTIQIFVTSNNSKNPQSQ